MTARILILLSDTGGGHRASARALEAAFKYVYRDQCPEIRMIDIWTDYGNWPFNSFVSVYRYATENPWCWKFLYEGSQSLISRSLFLSSGYAVCGINFRKVINSYKPDLILSVHPLCQHVPLQIMKEMKEMSCYEAPFVTVVTDLGGCHPTWFHPKATRCYVPSAPVKQIALDEGMHENQLRLIGLPVRPEFWKPRQTSPADARKKLGLLPNVRTVLVMGGGEGVGGLEDIARGIVTAFFSGSSTEPKHSDVQGQGSPMSESINSAQLQMIVVCGKNADTKAGVLKTLYELQSLLTKDVLRVSLGKYSEPISKKSPPAKSRKISNASNESSLSGKDSRTSTSEYEGQFLDSVSRCSFKSLRDRGYSSDGVLYTSRRREINALRYMDDVLSDLDSNSDRELGNTGIVPDSGFDSCRSSDPQTGKAKKQVLKRLLSSLRTEISGVRDMNDQIVHARDNVNFNESVLNPASSTRKKPVSSFQDAMTVSPSAISPSGLRSVCSGDEAILGVSSEVADSKAKFNAVVYGFVTFMQLALSAADLIVTKAGPGTIAEAAITGVPILLSSYLPGQEEGNVTFVLEHKIGGYCVDPMQIGVITREWLTNDDFSIKLKNMGVRAKKAIDPESTIQIVLDIGPLIGLIPDKNVTLPGRANVKDSLQDR